MITNTPPTEAGHEEIDMKSKHTAGPYSCSEAMDGWHIITAHGGRIIADIHIEPGNGMDEANARLLTEAPKMHEALCNLGVVADAVRHCYTNRPEKMGHAILALTTASKEILALLARVRGESL